MFLDLELALIRVKAARKNLSAPWREIPIRKSLLAIMREWRLEDLSLGADKVIHYKGKSVSGIKSAWERTLARA